MKKLTCIVFCFTNSILLSQVGINTTTPDAQLDVKSSNQATPANTDGILIPKMDAFPIVNPTILQQGMLVYLTTVSGVNQPGFYYWDNVTVTWIGIISATNGDADFYIAQIISMTTCIIWAM